MDFQRLLVENILRHPTEFDWSVQGLGMMRLYLSQEVRLHIWDSALKVCGVSPIHNHPWNLDSMVIAGRYKQHRFKYVAPNVDEKLAMELNVAEIKCGENAEVVGEITKVKMIEDYLEIYSEGQVYSQAAAEVHLSVPDDGTVTLVKRTFKEDREHAKVFWRGRGGWVDAKPRKATPDEVLSVTKRSLELWF